MKKKFFLFVAILCMAFGFVGCEEKHTHSYTNVVTAPICTEKGYTAHTCSCGDALYGRRRGNLNSKTKKLKN